jgi:hypothetical protein
MPSHRKSKRSSDLPGATRMTWNACGRRFPRMTV